MSRASSDEEGEPPQAAAEYIGTDVGEPPGPDDRDDDGAAVGEQASDRQDHHVFDSDDVTIAEIIDDLERDDEAPVRRGELARVMMVMRASSGPLPDPDDLRQYDRIVPGGADRIMRMAEREQAHRHALETKHLGVVEAVSTNDYKSTRRGQNYGLIVCAFVLVTGIVFMLSGFPKTGAAIIMADLVGLVTVFIVAWERVNGVSPIPRGRRRPGPRRT